MGKRSDAQGWAFVGFGYFGFGAKVSEDFAPHIGSQHSLGFLRYKRS